MRFKCDYCNCIRIEDRKRQFKCTICGHGIFKKEEPKNHCCSCGEPIYFNVSRVRDVTCGTCVQRKLVFLDNLEKETEVEIKNANDFAGATSIRKERRRSP